MSHECIMLSQGFCFLFSLHLTIQVCCVYIMGSSVVFLWNCCVCEFAYLCIYNHPISQLKIQGYLCGSNLPFLPNFVLFCFFNPIIVCVIFPIPIVMFLSRQLSFCENVFPIFILFSKLCQTQARFSPWRVPLPGG